MHDSRLSPGPAECNSSAFSAEPPQEPSLWSRCRTAPGSWSRTTAATPSHPAHRKYQLGDTEANVSHVQDHQWFVLYRWHPYLGDRRVLTEVKVTAKVALMTDDLRQDVGVAGVAELSLLGELADIHQAQEIPFQLVHLVHYVSVQRENLSYTAGLLLITKNYR